MDFEFSQVLFLHLLRCFYSFILLIWWITLIDFQMVNKSCITDINLTWLWCGILFIYCWFNFLKCKTFASIVFSSFFISCPWGLPTLSCESIYAFKSVFDIYCWEFLGVCLGVCSYERDEDKNMAFYLCYILQQTPA